MRPSGSLSQPLGGKIVVNYDKFDAMQCNVNLVNLLTSYRQKMEGGEARQEDRGHCGELQEREGTESL